MVWSDLFLNAKFEVAEFYKVLKDETRSHEQVQNAFKGAGIVLLQAGMELTDSNDMIAQAELAQIGQLTRMIGNSMLDYELQFAKQGGHQYVLPRQSQ